MNRNSDKLVSFTKYCIEHPEERFWQALRNWSEYSFVIGRKIHKLDTDVYDEEDTFYIE